MYKQQTFIIDDNNFKYIISPSPNASSISYYKDLLFKNGITTVIKLCHENMYDIQYLQKCGIIVYDLSISDGSVPDNTMLLKWTSTLQNVINNNENGIAVHCMSGLGRAPLFVALGQIKIFKKDPIDTIEKIRKYAPKSLNHTQLNYLYSIKNENKICTIM